MSRTVAWFSAGAASTCATRLALKAEPDTLVVYCDPGSEHPDTRRYMDDVARWLGVDILTLRSDKYVDTWDVFDKTGYLVGTGGARCTTELKKQVRRDFQRDDDRQVFGFTFEERKRADQFRKTNPEVDLWTPLIDERMTKRDCHAMIREAGIEPHFMYQLGYKNANCVGCVKGGMGYWNKIRVDFPEVFQRMAEQERRMGISCNREEGPKVAGKRTSIPVFLDELAPDRGNYAAEKATECGVICPTEEGPLDEYEQSVFDLFDAAMTALERRSEVSLGPSRTGNVECQTCRGGREWWIAVQANPCPDCGGAGFQVSGICDYCGSGGINPEYVIENCPKCSTPGNVDSPGGQQ